MALNMARIYEGFVAMGPSLPGGPEEYFENISLPTFVAKSCLFNAQSLILDAIVVSHPFPVCCQIPRNAHLRRADIQGVCGMAKLIRCNSPGILMVRSPR